MLNNNNLGLSVSFVMKGVQLLFLVMQQKIRVLKLQPPEVQEYPSPSFRLVKD